MATGGILWKHNTVEASLNTYIYKGNQNESINNGGDRTPTDHLLLQNEASGTGIRLV